MRAEYDEIIRKQWQNHSCMKCDLGASAGGELSSIYS